MILWNNNEIFGSNLHIQPHSILSHASSVRLHLELFMKGEMDNFLFNICEWLFSRSVLSNKTSHNDGNVLQSAQPGSQEPHVAVESLKCL